MSQHGVESTRVFLALGQQLLRDDNRDFMDEWILGKELGLLVQDGDTLVETGFVCQSQHLTGLDFALDLVFELGHVKHQLIYLAGPHRKLLPLQVVFERLLL